jgi:ankyrin repeat protein
MSIVVNPLLHKKYFSWKSTEGILDPMRNLFLLLIAFLTACGPVTPVPPLCSAARAGDTAHLAELLKTGSDVDERGGVNNWTALMHAVHKNQIQAVRILIDAGADVNATAGTRGKATALQLAETENMPDIATLLRAHGAKRIS